MVALTVVRQGTSVDNWGTDPYTPGAFTPTAGRRLLVLAHFHQESDGGAEGTDLTISDDDVNITSWSVAATSANAPAGWSYGSRAWVSDQGASGSSMSVSVGCGANSVENYRVTVWEITDFGAIGATASGIDANGDGALAITLSAAPASSSIVVAAVNVALDSGGPVTTVTPGSGWTEVEDNARANWWIFQCQARTGSTGASVDWDDINDGGSAATGATAFAFEITDGAAATLIQEGFRWGIDDGSESTHTHAAAQDANITAPASQALLLNFLVDLTGDPGATTVKLQVALDGTSDWTDVPIQ